MSTTVDLDTHAKRANEYFDKEAALESQADDYRLNAGRELIMARRRVDAGETDLSWSLWCAQNIKRSDRDIRRVMKMARADDPAQAREEEKERNRANKPVGSRAASPFRALDEGVGAFLRGVPQDDCPYTDPKRHAAWRKGWSETEGRTGASPPVAPAPAVDEARHPLTELRQAMERCWPLLSHADQELLIDWQIEHMADPPTSAVAQESTSLNGPRVAARQPPSG
jgi:ribosome modulation factor